MAFKFEKLEAWQKAIGFCDKVIAFADGLPQRYQFSLGEQLRRAAISIPTNIAEGSGRDNPKESRYFYEIAKGSVYEVVSLLVVCGKRGALTREIIAPFTRKRIVWQPSSTVSPAPNGTDSDSEERWG